MNRISRRRMIATGALALPLAALADTGSFAVPAPPENRQQRLFKRRDEIARAGLARHVPVPAPNGDEDRYPDRRASFAKTLPHDEKGQVDPDAYRAWLAILASGDSAAFAHVPRALGAVERLNNPQAAYAIDLAGIDAAALPLAAPPSFADPAMAAETATLYWMALMRDVPFRDFASHPLAHSAASDLSAFGLAYSDPANLFRGETAGERVGPLVSQFLWQDVPYGQKILEQSYSVPAAGQSFLTSFDEWLACQRGARARAVLRLDTAPRYIATYRELVEYVHRDFSFQPYLNAALIMMSMGGGDAVLSPTNPYRGSPTQFGDITFGNKNLLTLLAQASLLAQKTAYYHKWQVHRRARPEVIGARVDAHRGGRSFYDLHRSLLESEALARSKAEHGSWLLPQAYPEGSPTHPSYPAAHAVNAGACATVLKAFFNEHYVIPDPVEATADGARLEPWRGDALTLGGEVDKLAANIAYARDAAGVHFRSDSSAGLKLGEEVALGLLAETSLTYSERFDGFVFSRFDGTIVRIAHGSVSS